MIFAQDGFGDQFFLRNNKVWKLYCETDKVESLNHGFSEWILEVNRNPEKKLGINLKWKIAPGKLLLAYSPFCTKDASKSKISQIDLDEVIDFHVEFASKMKNLKDGQKIKIKISE